MKHYPRSKQDAFTLIELIVAVGVFAIVATITTGTLLILTKAEKKAINVQTGYDNLRYALEAMAKEIRTGINYEQCPLGTSDNPTDCFVFVKPVSAATKAAVIYRYSTDGTECAENMGAGEVKCVVKTSHECTEATVAECKTNASLGRFHPVTAPEISVNSLKFYLSGVGSSDYLPRVTIIIQAETPGALNPLSVSLNLQTTVSQFSDDSF
jgi:prepilin-type N-terminal cleavage/methylation domain-containing protein